MGGVDFLIFRTLRRGRAEDRLSHFTSHLASQAGDKRDQTSRWNVGQGPLLHLLVPKR